MADELLAVGGPVGPVYPLSAEVFWWVGFIAIIGLVFLALAKWVVTAKLTTVERLVWLTLIFFVPVLGSVAFLVTTRASTKKTAEVRSS